MNHTRFVNLRPRLTAAAGLLNRVDTAADIGCDHGRLAVGLLQQGIASRVIASDISEASLEKARRLAHITGRAGDIDFRVGDGLKILKMGEADAIMLCGMGGALIAQILERAPRALMGARLALMQPMRGVAQLRAYLFHAGYTILKDSIALDHGRYYQVFCAAPGKPATIKGWPEDCFLIGPGAIESPLMPPYLEHMLKTANTRLKSAKGSRGEAALLKTIAQLEAIKSLTAQQQPTLT